MLSSSSSSFPFLFFRRARLSFQFLRTTDSLTHLSLPVPDLGVNDDCAHFFFYQLMAGIVRPTSLSSFLTRVHNLLLLETPR